MAKKLNVDLKLVEQLASKGYNVGMICSAVGINRTTAYKNSHIIDTIRKGAELARRKVIDDLMARSESDQSAAASIFLSKQLKVFDDYFTTSKPKNIKEALNRISTIYDIVSKNELSQEKGDKLVGYLNSYIRSFETSELEKRIQALEEKK